MPAPRPPAPDARPRVPCDAVAVGLVGLTPDWRVAWANRAAAERLGQPPPALTGLRLELLFRPGEPAADRLRQTVEARGEGHEPDARLARDDADIAADLWARRDDDGSILLTLADATARAALRAEAARLRDRLADAERAREKLGALQRELSEAARPPVIIGSSALIRRALDAVERVAPTGATVLISGETGVGKDLIARTIHARSPRAAEAFVAVNCAALPETLIESELFGHERGAFTGADRQRMGKFELADQGTLFLDEIAELSLQAQAKLLRVLQNGQFERVGGAETVTVDVRLVAATHRDLARQVERGRFREDLFYRLNVFRVDVPALRDRREDIRALVDFLHERHARRMGRPRLPLSERSVRRLLAYRWPGNIRELENAVERATLLSDGPELDIELPDAPTPAAHAGAGPGERPGSPRDVLLDLSNEQLQRMQILHALESCRWRVFGDAGAAKRLGLKPQTLLSRMDKYGIPRPRAMRGSRDK